MFPVNNSHLCTSKYCLKLFLKNFILTSGNFITIFTLFTPSLTNKGTET